MHAEAEVLARWRVCILGGTGFVGRRLAARLSAAGHEILVLTRHRERHKDLLVLPTVRLVEGSVRNAALLRREFRGQDAVINLVGILNERGRSSHEFDQVHVGLPQTVIQACRDSGVQRLLHMGALGAAEDAPSEYLRSKARGESLVMAAGRTGLQVTVFRPSVIFGRDDSFTNRFVRLLRAIPLVFPLACPESRLQPVHVEDVVQAMVRALGDPRTYGQGYNLCGPRVYTLREIVGYLAAAARVPRRIIALNDSLSRLQAVLLGFAPGKPFTLDNYRSLQKPSVCNDGFPTVFGITPSSLEDILPRYLGTARGL